MRTLLTGNCARAGDHERSSGRMVTRSSSIGQSRLFLTSDEGSRVSNVRRHLDLPPCIVRAQKTRHLLSSAVRRDLNCPHFNHCSGCSSQTVEQPPTVLYRARHFFSIHGVSNVPFWVGEIHGWRQRVKLAVRTCEEDSLCLGLFEAGTHSVQAIPECRYACACTIQAE